MFVIIYICRCDCIQCAFRWILWSIEYSSHDNCIGLPVQVRMNKKKNACRSFTFRLCSWARRCFIYSILRDCNDNSKNLPFQSRQAAATAKRGQWESGGEQSSCPIFIDLRMAWQWNIHTITRAYNSSGTNGNTVILPQHPPFEALYDSVCENCSCLNVAFSFASHLTK